MMAAQGDTNSKNWALIAGGFAGGIAASTCCILPLVLFWAGISGAWIGNLTAMAPYQPYFITASALFLGLGYYYVYRRPAEDCDDDAACARPLPRKAVKMSLWAATLLIVVASVFPYLVPVLLGE